MYMEVTQSHMITRSRVPLYRTTSTILLLDDLNYTVDRQILHQLNI